MDETNRPRNGRAGHAAIWILNGALVAIAVGLWLVVVPGAPAPGHAVLALPWFAFAPAFIAVEVLVVRFHFRGQDQAFSLAEVPLLLGLAFAGPAALVAGRLLGTFAVYGFRRQAPVKMVCNLATSAIETAVAATVYLAVLGADTPVSPRGWLAALCGLAAGNAASHVAVLSAIRLAVGPLRLRSVLSSLELATLIMIGNAGVALLAIFVLWVDPRAVFLMVAVTGGLLVLYRGHLALRQRSEGVAMLYHFTAAIEGVEELDDVATAVLREATELLHAGSGELVLVTPGGATRAALVGSRAVVERAVTLSPALAHAIETGEAQILAHPDRPEDLVGLVAPIRNQGKVVGALRVGDRSEEAGDYSATDLELFVALTNHASAAIRNAELVDRLRRDAVMQEHRALHDPLTGLANRTLFLREVGRLLSDRSDDELVAVFLMDLDGFKDVNDTLGHHVGDGLLQHVASELSVGFGTDGVVCRLGGDEFAVAVGRLATTEEAWALGRRIHAAVERPVAVDDLEVDVRASVGMAIAPGHGDNVSELLRRADVAMYDAKREATGLEPYAADRDHYSARRLSLAADLRRAIDNGDLTVYYQPQLGLSRRDVIGFEALVRWPHERHGFIPPDEFIPIAEQSGLIRPLTSLVLERTIVQAAEWRAAGDSFRVAVNISARSLFAAGLDQEVPALLARVGLPPSLLTLEVTESSVMTELARSVGVLSSLAASGIRLSIDDFGTGHSSLAQLRDLPVDEIKIDKSFVLNLARDHHDAAIVRSILELARNLGLEVVAEGIEDTDALQLLDDYGCAVGQGYFIAKPLPPSRVGEWLDDWRAKSTSAGPAVDEPGAAVASRAPSLRLVASD